MTLANIFALAVKHLGSGTMESSARLCLSDARRLEEAGDLEHARLRALASLKYSIGIFHPDYRAATT